MFCQEKRPFCTGLHILFRKMFTYILTLLQNCPILGQKAAESKILNMPIYAKLGNLYARLLHFHNYRIFLRFT